MTAQTILPANSVVDSGFNVANSLRFRGATANTYLTATFGSAPTLATKNTISLWFKRSLIDATQQLYATNNNAANIILNRSGASTGPTAAFYTNSGQLLGPRQYRDTSAWMHFVFAFDSTQGTEANRFKVYINGVEETSFDNTAYPAQEASQLGVNGQEIQIGTRANYDRIFDGYMAETAFVDGQALNATSFGEFDSDSGIWKPIDISGLTFGNNGFYLEYKQTGTSANSSGIGADTSGNDLHFAVNAFTAADQSTDTCTNNFATLNSHIFESSGNTFAEGNLKITGGGSDSWTTHYGLSTIAVSTGKWFVEAKVTTVQDAQAILGLISTSKTIGSSLKDNGVAAVEKSGRITGGGNNIQTSLTAFSNNDIAGLAFDATNGTAQFYRNGSAYGNAVSSIASDTYYFATTTYEAGGVVELNFGSPPYSESGGNSDANGYGNFSMAVPSGYFALNTKNLAEYG
jgi:hypothetical protein